MDFRNILAGRSERIGKTGHPNLSLARDLLDQRSHRQTPNEPARGLPWLREAAPNPTQRHARGLAETGRRDQHFDTGILCQGSLKGIGSDLAPVSTAIDHVE